MSGTKWNYTATQHIKMVSKAVRGHVDIWMLFKTKNEKMLLEDIYSELSALVSPEEVLSLYHYATSASDNDSLVYDGKGTYLHTRIHNTSWPHFFRCRGLMQKNPCKKTQIWRKLNPMHALFGQMHALCEFAHNKTQTVIF
jgi:hypothetical protein